MNNLTVVVKYTQSNGYNKPDTKVRSTLWCIQANTNGNNKKKKIHDSHA